MNFLLRLIEATSQIKNRNQVLALLLALVLVAFLGIDFLSRSNTPSIYSFSSFSVSDDAETIAQIDQTKQRIQADAIVVFQYVDNELVPIYSSNTEFKGLTISGFSHAEIFRQLRLGECDRHEDGAKSTGVKLPILICPVFRSTDDGVTMEGAIAGVFSEFPKQNSQGEIEPYGYEIWKLGILLEGRSR